MASVWQRVGVRARGKTERVVNGCSRRTVGRRLETERGWMVVGEVVRGSCTRQGDVALGCEAVGSRTGSYFAVPEQNHFRN